VSDQTDRTESTDERRHRCQMSPVDAVAKYRGRLWLTDDSLQSAAATAADDDDDDDDERMYFNVA